MTDEQPSAAPSAPRAGSRRRKLRLASLAGALVLFFVLGEVGMRVFRPAHPRDVRTHPLCWHVHRPDLAIPVKNVDTGETFEYRTNHFGFRGRSMKDEKRPKDAYRIFFVGGSTTQGNGLPEESTFPGLVEGELERRRGPQDLRVEAANAGEFGFNSAACYSMLVHEVLPHEPDIVFFMVAVNDLRMTLGKGWDEENHYWPPVAPENPAFVDWLCGVSGFARGIRGASRRLGLTSDDADDWEFPKRKPITKGVDMTRGLQSYKRYLHLAALACKDAGVELVLMTEASLYKDTNSPEEVAHMWMRNIGDLGEGPNCDIQEFRKGLQAYNEALRSAAAREGARLVDLEKVVPQDLKHFLDDVHLTGAGHAAVAKEIVSQVYADKPAQRRP